MPTRILGLSHHLPPEAQVGEVMRPIAKEAAGPSDLVLGPANRALEQAALAARDLEFLVFATMTPDVTFPGAACWLQEKLGCETVGALDVRGQCTGFLVALSAADSFLAANTYARILVAAAEVHSSGLDYSPRGQKVASLYGDGAAALVLGRGDGPHGVAAVVCHAEGRHYDRFWCEYPSSRQHPFRVTVEDLDAARHFPSLDFPFVEEFAREKLPAAVREVLDHGGVEASQVDCFVLSHILPGVVESAARTLDVSGSRLIDAGEAHGHLTAATLPVALSEAVESGRLGERARVCLAACGAGFTWGAALLTL